MSESVLNVHAATLQTKVKACICIWWGRLTALQVNVSPYL